MSTTVSAQPPDTSDWDCSLCVSPQGWALDLELGPAYVDEDAYRFGDYTGMDEKGGYLFGNVLARRFGEDGSYWQFEGERLGLESRALDMEGGTRGKYSLGLFYRKIPRFHYDTGETPFNGVGTSSLSLPGGWVRGSNTQNMSALSGALQPTKIEAERQNAGIKLRLTPTERWSFDANYKHTKKEGNDIFGGSFFFNAVQLVKPIDYETDEVQLQARYARDNWHLAFGYFGSFFTNGNDRLEWDNPYSSSSGADSGRAALAPDNSAQHLMVSGALRLPAKTTISGQLSVGRMEQDETLLPYTTNTSLSTSALPVNSADTQVDTANADLRVRSSAFERWVLSGKFGYDRRDNNTPRHDFDYVVADTNLSTDTVQNTAYSYRRSDYSLSGEYALASRKRVDVGYRYREYRRDNQEVGKTESNRFWAKYIDRAGEQMDIDLGTYVDQRDNSDYRTLQTADPQNPLMRKYNMADRRRVGVRVQTSWMPARRTSLGAQAEIGHDNYSDSQIGLQDSNRFNLGLDAAWAFGRQSSVYGALNYEMLDSTQANSSTFSQPNWSADSEDRFFTATIGLDMPRLSNRWGLDASYSYAASNGDITINSGGLASHFPALKTELHHLKLALDYRYNPRLSFRFGYGHQRYAADNWSVDNLQPDTVSNLLALGTATQDYDVNLVYITLRYRFGPQTRPFSR